MRRRTITQSSGQPASIANELISNLASREILLAQRPSATATKNANCDPSVRLHLVEIYFLRLPCQVTHESMNVSQ